MENAAAYLMNAHIDFRNKVLEKHEKNYFSSNFYVIER